MDTFHALADVTRRNIVEMLAYNGTLSASDISGRFPVSAPAISQHLKVLRDANLVLVERKAQLRLYSINTPAFEEVEDWVSKITKVWEDRFERLEQVLEGMKKK